MTRAVCLVAILCAAWLAIGPGCGDDARSGGDDDADSDTDTGTDPDAGMECTNGAFDGDYLISDEDDLTALSGYTEVTGALEITETTLTELDALQCLTAVGGRLLLADNDSLGDLNGLAALASVGWNVWIIGNAELTSLTGLSGLTAVGGELWIAENESLTYLTGLSGITTIPAHLIISDNATLTSLNGLSALVAVDDLAVHSNAALPDCEVCDLLDQLTSDPGSIDVHDNLADECTTVPQGCP